MKELLPALVFAMLSGCAVLDAYEMKYDTNEYKLVTEVRHTASLAKDSCDDAAVSAQNAVTLAGETSLFAMYAEHQPHNAPTISASKDLDTMAQGLKKSYNGKVSLAFCKIKFGNIEKSAETIQQTVGKKPR